MDRYIVNNNVSGQTTDQAAADGEVMSTATSIVAGTAGVSNEQQPTFIMHPGTSKMIEATSFKLDANENEDIDEIEGTPQYEAKQIVETQFAETVGNTTYIIENNSSNSVESVRIGNHSYVPVVDPPLYNIQVAGGQYAIEGVVNQGLGNYIIETPAYIVETKPVGTHTMYIQHSDTTTPIQTEIQDPKKDKNKKDKKKRKTEEGPFFCIICNSQFPSAGSLRYHQYHHNPKYSCIGCDKGFEKERAKDEHELICDVNYTNNKFKCIFCDLPFSTPKALRNHENKHRPVRKTKKYKHMCICIKCNKTFDAINTLKMHIKKIHGGNAGPDKKKKKKKQLEMGSSAQEVKLEGYE